MKKHLGVWLVLLTCACGSSSSDNKNSPTPTPTAGAAVKVMVNGTVAPLPFLTDIGPGDLPYAKIVLVNPQDALANPNVQPTILGTVNIDPNKCGNSGCLFTIPDVDISNLTIGLAAGVFDQRTDDTATLFNIFTGVAQTSVVAAKASGNLNDVYAFAVRKDGFAKFASATQANDLVQNGVLIGYAVNTSLQPVADANLITPGAADQFRKWYPGFDGNHITDANTTMAGPTSGSGYIVVSAQSAKTETGIGWTLVSTTGTPTWTIPTLLGTAPNFALIVPFLPNP